MEKVYTVQDRWHGRNGLGVVRSDDPRFNGDIREFFGWILQHGGSVFEAKWDGVEKPTDENYLKR